MRGQDRQTPSPRPLTILLSLISLQHPLSISLMSPIAPSSHPLYIVTGATGGIGGAVAEALAREGKTLVLACRNVNAAEALAHRLRNDVQGVEILVLHLDLSSFNGVRRFVDDLKKLYRPVAALVNVAGTMTRHSTPDASGVELDYRVNCLSTALLARLVSPLMPPRSHIVFTTSVTRMLWDIPQPFPRDGKFSQLATYGRSKLALTVFAHCLAEELRQRDIRVACADPGVVDTAMITMHRWFDRLADILFRPFISTPRKGAEPLLRALADDATCRLHTCRGAYILTLRESWKRREADILAQVPIA